MTSLTLFQWRMSDDRTQTAEPANRSRTKALPTAGRERRIHRRHDLEQQGIRVERVDGSKGTKKAFGQLVDLSAGGVRIRTNQPSIHPDQQIRVRLELPAFAGICAFVDTSGTQPQPARHWTGWMSVARVQPVGGGDEYEVGGKLVDMEDLDRGMLGLYLSTQPMAA